MSEAAHILEALGSGSLGTLLLRLTADSTELVKGMEHAVVSVTKGSDKMVKATLGVAATAAGAFTAIGLAAVHLADEFEESFLAISKRMQGSFYDTQRLEEAFRGLSRAIPVNVNEINKVAGAALKLGISKENVVEFTKTMVDFGTVTHESVEESSKQIVRFGQLLQIPQNELERVASSAVKLGSRLATSAGEVLDMTSKIGAMGKAAGLTAPQIMGLAAGLTSAGVDAGRGGMAFNKMLGDMAKSVAAQDANLQRFAATAGMTGDAFTKAFKEDAAGAILSFMEGLNQVQKSGGDVLGILERMGLSGAQIDVVLLKAAGNTALFAKAMGMSAHEWEHHEALAKSAELSYETFGKQMMTLWNRVKDFLLGIGLAIMPILQMGAKWMLKFTDETSHFAEKSEYAAGVFRDTFIAAIGAVGDVWMYFKVGFLGVEVAIELALAGLLKVVGAVVKGMSWLIEGAINGIVAGANLAIRTINAITDKLPDWMGSKSGKHIDELKFKLNIDASDADKLADKLVKDAAAASVYLGTIVTEGKFSDKMLAEYSKIVTGATKQVKGYNEEIEKSIKQTVAVSNAASLAHQKRVEEASAAIDKMSLSGKRPGSEIAFYKGEIEKLKSFHDLELSLDKEHNEKRKALLIEYYDKVKELTQAQQQLALTAGESMFGTLASMAEQSSGKQSASYKTMFAMQKAFSIATAMLNIKTAISDAWGKGGTTIWEKLAAVAIVGAQTASILSSMMAVKLTFAGGKAMGGSVSPGSTFLVGEKGPELFAPSQSGTIIPNHKLGGSSPVRVVVNNYTDVQPRVTEKNDDQGRVIDIMIRRVKDEISGDIRNGSGVVPAAMEKSFDLRRKGK
jgi:TP901 family phage tail tape measure protein